MARYEHDGVSFDVPRDWEDKCMAAFTAPIATGSKSAANVVMTRDTLKSGETLSSYTDKQLVDLAKQLTHFDLVGRTDTTLGGLPAVELRFSWKGGVGFVEQRLVSLVTVNRKVLNFTATVPRAEVAKLGPIFDRIFASVKFDAKSE